MAKGPIGRSLPKEKTARKLSSFIYKIGDQEIKHFLIVLSAFMRQVPCPREARCAYLAEVERRLRNEGGTFLAQSRGFPTAGLKLLGRDLSGFPLKGFKKQSGEVYPRLFSWFWSELKRLSSVSQPSKNDVLLVRRILTVLSFARMIRCSSVNQVQKAVANFELRVTSKAAPVLPPKNPTSGLELSGHEKGLELWRCLGLSKKECLEDAPRYVDLTSLSFKSSALKDEPRFPKWFRDKFDGLSLVENVPGPGLPGPSIGFKDGPFGRLHIITERGGKLRCILPYNTPFVHSTGLYARCRSILRRLPGDFSSNQSAGHRFVQKLSGQGLRMVSADLSNMTDDIKADNLSFLFSSLNVSKISRLLFNLPVELPNLQVITPSVLLMGLKGCFESASVLHHFVVKAAGISSYAMCGDDLFFVGDLSPYEKLLEWFGPKLNRGKTVVSDSVAVFCGEYFWRGHSVSPIAPSICALYSDEGYASATIVFATTRAFISSMSGLYSQKKIVRIVREHLQILRKVWKGPIFSSLPQKLRGLGLYSGKAGGLASLLGNRRVRECALKSIGIDRKTRETQRWFGLPVELASNPVKALDYIHTLYKSGGISLKLLEARAAPPKNISKLVVLDVYEWYYKNVRLEPSRFGLSG